MRCTGAASVMKAMMRMSTPQLGLTSGSEGSGGDEGKYLLPHLCSLQSRCGHRSRFILALIDVNSWLTM